MYGKNSCITREAQAYHQHSANLVSFPDPAPLRGKQGLGTLVDFLGILCVSNHVHFSNKRVIRELRIVSCPGGGVWVAVTREFERDNCVISEILQSDWTIPNRAGVPRKSTKVPRPSFRVWAGRSGHETSANLPAVVQRIIFAHARDTVYVKLERFTVTACLRKIVKWGNTTIDLLVT